MCLLLALQWGGTTYDWSNSKVWGTLLGFGLLILAFIALQFQLKDRYSLFQLGLANIETDNTSLGRQFPLALYPSALPLQAVPLQSS